MAPMTNSGTLNQIPTDSLLITTINTSYLNLFKTPAHFHQNNRLQTQTEGYRHSNKLFQMASMASPKPHFYPERNSRKPLLSRRINVRILSRQKPPEEPPQNGRTSQRGSRRELILWSSEIAVLGAIFHFSGTKPNYLGVQKNPPSLALCPATNNCVSTSENISDRSHYAPPWDYNPVEGRGSKNPASKEQAMKELLDVIKSTKPENFTPKVTEKSDDYVRVEYESPIMGFVDDVEFWFPPGKKSIVKYRSASRLGNFDFDVNRKRIKALRLALEKKGWASEDSF